MQQQIVEEIIDAQCQGRLSVALLAISLVDEDTQACTAVETVVVVDVDAAYGLRASGQVNHQAELLLGHYVVVAQKKLFDLETGVGDMRPTHPPDFAVVFPLEYHLGILRLGVTQCYYFVFDKHLIQIVEKYMVSKQIGT